MQQLHSGSRGSGRKLDIIHIVLGILILVMAALAFLDPEQNMMLFPLIFLTAALLRLISAGYTIIQLPHEKKRRARTAFDTITGILLLLLTAISAVEIWR